MLKNSMMGGNLKIPFEPTIFNLKKDYDGKNMDINILKYDNPTEWQKTLFPNNDIKSIFGNIQYINNSDKKVNITIKKDTKIIVFNVDVDMYSIRLFSDMIKPINNEILPDLSNSFILLTVNTSTLQYILS